MRIKAFLAAGAVGSVILLGAGAAPAWADNGPHVSTAGNTSVDRCAACHRAHTAQAQYLTRQAQPALCYTCHGSVAGGATTDVADGIGYAGMDRGGPGTAGSGALRGGGFQYALIDSSHATRTPSGVTPVVKTVPVLPGWAPATSSHSIDGSLQVAWGNGAISATANPGVSISLRCGSCHDPHGNGNYRILRPVPVDSSATAGVTIPDSSAHVYTTTNYWATDDPYSPSSGQTVTETRNGVVTTYTPDVFLWNISAWCTQCHSRYLAPTGSYKTDSGDAVFKFRHRSDQNYKEGGANCITCHVAHGTNALMSGANSGAVGTPDGNPVSGDSKLLRVDNRGTCNMCHNV